MRQSVRLEAHYVHPMCSPTRAALMTGRYASRFGVTGAQNPRALRWDTETLASALKSAGYETALTGKWHLGSKPEEGPAEVRLRPRLRLARRRLRAVQSPL